MYIDIFKELIQHAENEVIEFKKAENNFDFDDLGKYFSAISNETNIRNVEFGWIILGYDQKNSHITGTSFKDSEASLNKLKLDISQHTTEGLTFREVIPIYIEGKRVLMFQIPATPRNIVMKWKRVAYGRDGESLQPLSQEKQDEIRNQLPIPDWSAELLPSAKISDLDDLALATAKVMYKKVHAHKIAEEEIDNWNTDEFLCHSGVMRDGKLTRAAIILLGKPTSINLLFPAVIQITWTLEDSEGEVIDYEHFSIPYILNVDKVLGKVRNLTMRELPGGTLFPDTMKQYDDYTIREALHNAIAHQDYTLQKRITFVESPDRLYYGNGGTFLPGTIQNAIQHRGPQLHYRNDCLCKAMVNFNMIDTVGRGIKKIFTEQKKRYFPMPDYIIDNEGKEIGVTIYGKIIDPAYTDVLKSGLELTLNECIMLDAIQKDFGKNLSAEDIAYLKAKRLIEGKKGKYIISLKVAKLTHQIGTYTHKRGLTAQELFPLIISLAEKAGSDGFTRGDVYDAVAHLLPSANSKPQNLRLVSYLLVQLADRGTIISKGKKWFISQK